MFTDSYTIIISISLLVILSYLYSSISVKTKIPSVLMLLFTGILFTALYHKAGYELPDTKVALQFFGIIGVILIVLEGSLELKLERDKLGLIAKSFFSALVILLVSAFSIAGGIKIIFSELTFHVCLVNAIPLAVISSAIAIPSVEQMEENKKEFIVYESIFSDILGILIFNIAISSETIESINFLWLGADLIIVVLISIAFTFLMLMFINKTTMNIKFFLMLAILILLYAVGKKFHLSALLMILFFGLFLNNLDIFGGKKLTRNVDIFKLRQGIDRFRLITNESAFLIRTFFFFIFGASVTISVLFDSRIIISGTLIVLLLYGIRFLYLKFLMRRNIFPELFIAPRGLITILLYYAIPEKYSIGVIGEGDLLFVILVTSLVMMFGLMGNKTEIPEMEIYASGKKIEDAENDLS